MIARGYILPAGEYRLYVADTWEAGTLGHRVETKIEAVAALVAAGYGVPDASGWELRGDTDADGWVITGPATAPMA